MVVAKTNFSSARILFINIHSSNLFTFYYLKQPCMFHRNDLVEYAYHKDNDTDGNEDDHVNDDDPVGPIIAAM